MGESGVEVLARNSHSMCILKCDDVNFLVIYGGASPELGPLDDVIYAELPDHNTIGALVISTLMIVLYLFCLFIM